MKNKIPVASHLSDKEYALLLRVYADHNRSMGIEIREQYDLSKIIAVERNIKEKCLQVYFDNGDWWHYSATGEWY